MKDNIFVNNGNGTSTLVIESKAHGTKLILIDTNKISDINHIKWCINKANITKVGPTYYVCGRHDGKSVKLHRVLLNTPAGLVSDHINNDTLDNRLANLRAVTNRQNAFNQPRAKGYAWHKATGKWQAYIKLESKLHYLGLFDTSQEARQAYIDAKLKMHII